MTVVLAFVLTAGDARKTTDGHTSSSASQPPDTTRLPAVKIAAPPAASAATEAACVKVLAALPQSLTADLPPRRTETTSSLVRAWGEPAVVLRCGVTRPTDLTPSGGEQLIAVNDVNWLPVQSAGATTFTSVDRAVAVEVVVPKASVAQPLAVISDAVKTLPATCTTIDAAGKHDPNLPICGSSDHG